MPATKKTNAFFYTCSQWSIANTKSIFDVQKKAVTCAVQEERKALGTKIKFQGILTRDRMQNWCSSHNEARTGSKPIQ